MRWRALVGLFCLIVVTGAVGVGGYGLIHYVLKPAANSASGPLPNPVVKEVPAGPNITFATTTTVAKPHPKTRPTHPTPNRSLVAATAQLTAVTPGLGRCVVTAGSSFDAATYDQYGHIEFWQYADQKWAPLATRLYPPDAGDGSANYSSTGHVSVTGQVLVGMTQPIYIVSGRFSPDGTGNDLAFSEGTAGWGVVVSQSDGEMSSDGGSLTDQGAGLEWGERFVAGRFETLQRPQGWTSTFDSEFPVTELWSWQTGAFDLVTSNVATAEVASAPSLSAPSVPTSGSIPDGTYAGRLLSVSTVSSSVYPLLRLSIEPGAVITCSGGRACFEPEGGTATAVVGSTTTTSYAVTSGGNLTWVSGPAWGLAVPGGVCCSSGYRVTPTQLEQFGASSWYVPTQLGVTSFVEGTQPVVELTYRGQVTALAEPVSGGRAG